MTSPLYFDCCATYGPWSGKQPEARWRLSQLIEDLDLAGIAGALVQHAQQIKGDHMRANRTLIQDIRDHRDRLFPCWVALPNIADGFPNVRDFMAELKASDVRAVRIEADALGLPLSESLWGELRDALVAENILAIVEVTRSRHDFEPIDRLLRLFDGTNTLLTGHCWNHWRAVESLVADHPKLHIEFSTFQANRAVEYFATRYGASRCLFGTGLMAKAPGAARGFLDWSLLAAADVALIASGNLVRLLKGAGPRTPPPASPWDDSLTAATRAGRPLPCDVWDNHCHILHDGSSSAGGSLVFYRGDAAGMVEIKRRTGIDKTAIMSWEAPCSGDVDLGNQTVARAVERYPDSFIGLASIDPVHQTEAEMAAVIQTYHVERHFPGLKILLDGSIINYDDPRLRSWYDFADAHRLYAVIDPCGRHDSAMIANLAKRHPHMRISLDHCGQSWPYARWAADMVKAHPSVDAQLTFTSVTNGVIEYLVEQCGADRVMFGTDTPMRDPRPQASWLVFTRLPEAAKVKIFGSNFKALLNQVRW